MQQIQSDYTQTDAIHAVESVWEVDDHNFPFYGSQGEMQLRFLLQYAILAPSTRNTQPWKFAIEADTIRLFVDTTRWLRVADAEQRELYISAGCALENLLIAATRFGFATEVQYLPDPENNALAAIVRFSRSTDAPSSLTLELFGVMPERVTHHEEYDGTFIPRMMLRLIQELPEEPGIHLFMTEESDCKRKVDLLIAQADAIEFADSTFREELGRCIGQSNFGTPWLIAVLGQLAVSYLNLGHSTSRHDHELIMSSPMLGILSAETDDRETWIKTGRVFERLSLLLTAHGICIQPISQLVQVPGIRTQLASLLPNTGLIPHHPFRIGYAKAPRRHTPRRPLEEFLL